MYQSRGPIPGSPNIGPVWSPNFWTGPESKFLDRSVSRFFSSRSGSASSSLRGGGGDVAARALWMKISAWVRCSPSFEPALLPWPSSPCGGGQSWPDSLVFPQPAPVVLTGRPVKSSLPRATARFCIRVDLANNCAGDARFGIGLIPRGPTPLGLRGSERAIIFMNNDWPKVRGISSQKFAANWPGLIRIPTPPVWKSSPD